MANDLPFLRPRQGIRVAVVQSASEVVHYAYGDSSEVFHRMGCRTQSFTEHDVRQLAAHLDDDQFDLVVLATNCLNSVVTRQELLVDSGKDALSRFVGAGKGLLVQHQLGMARRTEDEEHFPFLPAELSGVRARARDTSEPPYQGRLGRPRQLTARAPHIVEVAPNRIDFAAIEEQATTSAAVRALYWHYWSDVDVAWWDPLAYDVAAREARCLMLASREADASRVVLTSIPFDWQRQEPILANIVSFLADGRPGTVILTEPGHRSAVTGLAAAATRAAKVPFREWEIGSDDARLIAQTRDRVFDTVVVAQDLVLPEQLKNTLNDLARGGAIRVVTLPATSGAPVALYGEQLDLDSMAREFTLTCSAMCATGLVDGSFWATVDSLRALNGLSREDFAENFPGVALERARRAEQPDGSYDGVYAATVGLAWLKWRFSDPTLTKTLSWLDQRLDHASARDHTFYWMILAELGRLSARGRERALEHLKTGDRSSAGQAGHVLAAEFALAMGEYSVAASHIEDLSEILASAIVSGTGPWLDLGLASDALRVSSRMVYAHGFDTPGVRACLEHSAQPILQWTIERQAGTAQPLSARIQAKLLLALKTFIQESPVSLIGLSDILDSSTAKAARRLSHHSGSDLIEALRIEHTQLEAKAASATASLERARSRERRRRRRRLPAQLSSIVVFYLLSTLVVAGVRVAPEGWASLWDAGFVQTIGLHIGFLSLVLAGASVYPALADYLDRRRSRFSDTKDGEPA